MLWIVDGEAPRAIDPFEPKRSGVHFFLGFVFIITLIRDLIQINCFPEGVASVIIIYFYVTNPICALKQCVKRIGK
jgi:hypothetical protein